jgi:hypothetical protein
VIVPQATIEYVHEFLNDQRSVGFRLAQDFGRRRFLFQTDNPDGDYVNLAVGASVVLRDGLSAFVNFRELLAYRDRSSQPCGQPGCPLRFLRSWSGHRRRLAMPRSRSSSTRVQMSTQQHAWSNSGISSTGAPCAPARVTAGGTMRSRPPI